MLLLGKGHDIPEGARVSVCPKAASWFAVDAGDAMQKIQAHSFKYVFSRPSRGAHGKKPRLPDGS